MPALVEAVDCGSDLEAGIKALWSPSLLRAVQEHGDAYGVAGGFLVRFRTQRQGDMIAVVGQRPGVSVTVQAWPLD